MASRALIIAIEDYPKAQGGVAQSLPGTLNAGLEFKKWLEEKWRSEARAPDDGEIMLCSSPRQPDGLSADAADITQAVYGLMERGRGMTEELYVFFSGHGFAFVEEPGSRTDVIMSADFLNGRVSGACCFKLDMLKRWLRDHMGPGRHFYFIDACRNTLSANDVAVSADLVWDRNTSPDASTFTLQSTKQGAVAAVHGSFPQVLIEGLSGKGRAKTWPDGVTDYMVVRYDSLRAYVKKSAKETQVSSSADGEEGESDAILATLRPVPTSKCTIEIDGADQMDRGTLVLTRGRANAGPPQPFTACPPPLILEPDDYTLRVLLTGATLVPDGPVRIDLYEDHSLRFVKHPVVTREGAKTRRATISSNRRAAKAAFDIMVPPGGEVSLRSVNTGSIKMIKDSGRYSSPPGGYLASLRVNGSLSKRREYELTTTAVTHIDLADWRKSLPHQSIAGMLTNAKGSPELSGLLVGPESDPDLDLWLALVGGARILGSSGDDSKHAHLPLHDFSPEPAGASPTYILAGLEDASTRLEVSVSRGANADWQVATEPRDMAGIRQAYVSSPRGPLLVSLRVDGGAAYTLASHAIENRATLITVTLDGEGRFRLAQYLFPMGHLVDQLPTEVRDQMSWRNQMQDLRFLAQASRAFRKRRKLEMDVTRGQLKELLYAKWLDPIGSALACYELLRRGEGSMIEYAVENMLRFFPDLPDTPALARLLGKATETPSGPPIFSDGLRAFEDVNRWLPLPASHLDFSSPWTAWRAAIT